MRAAALMLSGAAMLWPVLLQAADPAQERFDWTRRLSDLLPAIRACLVATPGSSALVTVAWPADGDMAGVRTRSADARRWECFAPAAGGAVDRIAPLDLDADGRTDRLDALGIDVAVPPEGPLFTPAPDGPPLGNCYRHERAYDEAGVFVGWLSHIVC